LHLDRGEALLDTLKSSDEDFVNAIEQNFQEQPACKIVKPYDLYVDYQYPHLSHQKQAPFNRCTCK
jgi:hypothetical protein